MSLTNNIGANGYGPSEVTYQINKYPAYTRTYYGDSASVAVSASVYFNNGWTVKVTEGNPWKLEANIQCELGGGINPITGTGSYVTVNWSLHYKVTDKEILHVNQDVIPWINQILPQDKVVLDNFLANPPKNGLFPSASFSTNSLSVSSSMVVFNMIISGTKTVPVTTPILRKSMTVPSTFDMSSFNTNVLAVYTKGTLSSNIGIPSNWYAIMPQGTDPSSTVTNGIPYHYGWLKQPPTQDQNGTTITIQQEFEYGLYPQNIYGNSL